MRFAFGLILAIASAGCFAASYIGQHQAVARLDTLAIGHPFRSLRRLFASRVWLLAYASSWIGWGLYIAALSLAPLSIVQAVSAGTIGLLALAAHHSTQPITRKQRQGAMLAAAGLMLVLGSIRTVPQSDPASLSLVLEFVAGAIGVAAFLVVIARGHSRGAALGAASGLCYGAGDIATKATVLGAPILTPVFLTCAALGFVTLQLSYQRASLLASAGLSSLLTNSIPIVAGVILFNESPPHGPDTWLRVIGFAAIVLGAFGFSGDRKLT